MTKHATVAADMALNVISSTLPVIILQLLVLPIVASKIGDVDYGLALSLIALLSLFPATIGNVLDNLRLLYYDKHQSNLGSFAFLLFIGTLLGAAICFAFALYYTNWMIPESCFLAALSILTTLREYYAVAYRLKLNFKGILLNNLLLCAGYLVGLLIFMITALWEIIYLVGLAFSLIFLFRTTDLWKERPAIGNETARITKDAGLLLTATTLGRTTSYADRIILYPLLGGNEVSIYYVSTLFGKILSMAVNPINSVILSYITRLKSLPQKAFWLSFLVSLSLSVLGYFATMLLAYPVIDLLYPQFSDQAMPYVRIMTIASYVHVLITITNPYILKFFNLKWQIALNGLYSLTYICLGLILLKTVGLYGFCLGTLTAEILRLIMQLLIYFFRKNK